MDRQALADRIVAYSDTVVAFCAVNGFAFLIALGEPDIRCSIAEVGGLVGAINLAVPIASSLALRWLRRIELRLRTGDGADAHDEDVEAFWRVIVPVRHALVWLFAVLVLSGIVAAGFDARCGPIS
jgi:hypothetical protein